MVQFCYSRLYLGTETVSCACGMLLRKANLVPGKFPAGSFLFVTLGSRLTDMDGNLKKNWTNFRKYASMPAQIGKKIILWPEPINWNEQLP